jgi:hypothetical protein
VKSTIDQIRAAWLCSTPLIAVRTADPTSVMESVKGFKKQRKSALLQWDICNGLRAIDRPDDDLKPGAAALKKCLGDVEQSSSTNPVEALGMLARLPNDGICFFHNAHRFIMGEDIGPIQAMWNLRDDFKATARMLILICPSVTLPAELQQDVLVIDDPLPTDADLKEIALRLYKETELPEPDAETQEKIVDATLGLAAFPAEQTMAMSLTKKGIELEELWSRKRQVIEGNPGLSVWRGKESFDDLGGISNLKSFLLQVISGVEPPRCLSFIDEIEKAIGTGQDTSGVSQGMLGNLLTYMQDTNATGMILIGPPGTGKSMIAKAAGNAAGIPIIALDLSGMKNALVGSSEANLRNALKVISAVGQGRILFIATCNSIAVLPPELRRRFTFGTFFLDMPSRSDRESIWKLYCKKYGVEGERPDDIGWTGAEIRQCADLARRLKCSLIEAATYVVPVSRSAADQIQRLCREADGRYISASEPGLYKYCKEEPAQVATGVRRQVQFGTEEVQ